MTQFDESARASIDQDLAEHLVSSRRDFFTKAVRTVGALASGPVVLAAASSEAFGAGRLPRQIVDVLNFALTLEYLEDGFYREGQQSGVIPAEYRRVFRTIGRHETAHVKFLKSALGKSAVKKPQVDFTAGGQYADVFENFDTFLTLSQTFEDLGVAAYKGQAGNLISSDPILTAALRIHSVEARHAAEVRRIGNKAPWDAAFDEPKSKEEVLAAATPFIRGM